MICLVLLLYTRRAPFGRLGWDVDDIMQMMDIDLSKKK